MTPAQLREADVIAGSDQTLVHEGGNHATGQEMNGNGTAAVQQDDALQGRELVAVVEALLFVSGEPISVARLATVIGAVSKAEVEQALKRLEEELAQDGRGIQLVKLAGGYRLVTKPDYAPWLKRLDKAKAAQKLSRSALESLAIIAYKQPLVRAEIEEIRGVETSGVLRTLLERKLVRIVGRKEVPGRPIMYGTTKFFLEHFGLQDITQLPPLREFKELGEAEQALLPIEDPMNPEDPMTHEGSTGDADSQTLTGSPVLAADEGDTLLVS
jgi:segregation and condensation protein B